MELPGSGYFFALATLGFTFVGFCSIVFVLRPSRDSAGSYLHRMLSRAYIELGFTAAGAAMLPPLLAGCGVQERSNWRASSAIIAAALIFHTWIILRRFLVSMRIVIPSRAWFFTIITAGVVVILLANAVPWHLEPGPGPIMLAGTWRLVMGAMLFILTFENFLEPPPG